MDAGFTLKHENPKTNANLLSKLFFAWMIKFCYKGTRKGLEVIDLYRTLSCDKSDLLGDKLEKHWIAETTNAKSNSSKPSLLRALLKTFIWNYMLYGLLLFVQAIALRSCQPVVLSFLIKQFEDPARENSNLPLYISAGILVAMSTCIVFLNHHINFGQNAIGMRLRISVSSLVYRKIMRLNKKSLGRTAAGQVINLLSNDVNRFDLVMISLHYFWIMPFQVVLVTYFIWQEVGISCLAGVLSMALLTLPVQSYLGKLTSQLRLQVAERTDSRVKLMNEIIQGIQVIKMYAWEKPFEHLIKQFRSKEIYSLTKASYLRGIYLSCMVFIERSTLFLTVICYVLSGNIITADKVFSMAQFFNILQLAMAIFYPMAISLGAETLVSIQRLQDFLVLEERERSAVESIKEHEIQIMNLNASWVPSAQPTLNRINIHIQPGTLCAVVGPVGSGKSSLLNLILGELPPTFGRIIAGGSISYASQEPWLFASTVRKNILFGQDYDRLRYRNIIKVCALKKDLEQFPQGDQTVVGERGVSLSGGQRARINLARAIYRDADIYLLDDPLSAVDTHVGKHLFNECIFKHLKHKTRILVTHQLQFLKKAHHIVVLNEGFIEAQGTFLELSNSNLDFTKLLVAADETADKEKEEVSGRSIITRKESILSNLSFMSETVEIIHDDKENEEQMTVTGISPFKEYFKSTDNICMVISLIIILILGQTACSAADWWVAFWTNQEALRHANISQFSKQLPEHLEFYNNDSLYNYHNDSYFNYDNNQQSEIFTFNNFKENIVINEENYSLFKTNVAIYIYSILIVAAIALTLIRSFLFFKVAMKASTNLHTKMFHSLLQTPMRFFDTNPSGRVLNRFSKDMGAIDEIFPKVLIEAIQITLVMVGILVNVTIANYYIVVAIVLLGILFCKLRSWYIATAKDIKHLEGITKSPVFSHVNCSLNGLTTIRASNAEAALIKEFDDHQDTHTSAWFLIISSIVSFGLWLDIVCVLFVAIVTFSFIILHQYTQVSGSLVGLAISQSLILTGMLQHGMRQSAEVVNQLTSVERVLHYTKLDKEGPFEPLSSAIQSKWPSRGAIKFKHLFLKYSLNDPPILKDLNINIKASEKIGIVGRTGAGKSSLISAVFRLAPTEGCILIDGVDTKSIGLNELRKGISIIPQEPVLFSATLRNNLDPFNEYEDIQLWNALDQVELKDTIDSLDFHVSEGGGNFSLGQRQLLCLARAILRNNKILVLDEATANVDPKTDALIQATIRRKFHNCTVLTIAHRLNTIMDSDKVLVMDGGANVEFDHPHILLQNSEGYFHKMVLETGASMSHQLKDVALEAFKNL